MALTGGRTMTNELEKQFFDTFGFEPNCQNTFINPSKCPFNESRECCDCVSFEYPQISDLILLELICLFTREMNCTTNYWYTVDELKENLLREFILEKDNFSKHQVQALFEEG